MKQSVGLRILIIGALLAVMLNAIPTGAVKAYATSSDLFTLQIHLPEGAEIYYLRLYFYDADPSSYSTAWLTIYDGSGNTTDLSTALSDGSSGYGQTLSAQINHIVDNEAYTYVLNWRPGIMSPKMRLMGMRIAYVPSGAGSYSYVHVAGNTFTPRASTTEWRYPGSGGIYAASWDHFLPFLRK
ncbi:MAG: hypothetical protein AB2L16_10165 [Anaerolineaceae bacterium]